MEPAKAVGSYHGIRSPAFPRRSASVVHMKGNLRTPGRRESTHIICPLHFSSSLLRNPPYNLAVADTVSVRVPPMFACRPPQPCNTILLTRAPTTTTPGRDFGEGGLLTNCGSLLDETRYNIKFRCGNFGLCSRKN